MGNRFAKWTAVMSAVALLSGVLVVTANAHIGASHSAVATDGPDLVSASAEGRSTAEFCFDEAVEDVNTAAGFHVVGYDSEYEENSDSADETGECVEVDFTVATDFDLRETTVAQIDQGAVEDADGDQNPVGAVALEGSELDGGEGVTTAPNLVSFESTSDSVIYTFDQELDCSIIATSAGAAETADAENFGYYDEDDDAPTGNPARDSDVINYGDTIDSCDADEIEVEFADSPDGEDIDDEADRVFVATESNQDAETESVDGGAVAPSGDVCAPDSDEEAGACTQFEALGAEIEDRPNLTDADRSDADQWLYSFDDDVEDDAASITDTFFHIYQEDGNEAEPTGGCQEDNESQVECTYANVDWDSAGTTARLPADYATESEDIEEAQDSEIPLAAVEHCAVEEVDTGSEFGACGTYGHVGLASSEISDGVTDGPDLETLEVNAADELATFCFDENVSDDETEDIDDNNFFLLEVDGDRTSAGATSVDDVEGACVTLEFDEEDLNAAVAGGADRDAVVDWLENENVEATVGTEVTDSGTTTTGTGGTGGTATTTTTTTTGTGGTATTTTTTTTGTTTGTGGGPVNRTIATTLTIRYDRNANQFKGSASARARRCQAGRLVTLKKHRPGPNRSVGTDTTNRSGNWSIRKRVRRGRFYAVVARKTFTNRTGGTTTCSRDKSVTIKIGRRR